MSHKTGTFLLPAVQSTHKTTREMTVTFAEDVSVLTEDFFNI